MTDERQPTSAGDAPTIDWRLVTGWLLLAGYAGITAWLGDIDAGVRSFQFAYVLGFIGYGLVLWGLQRRRFGGHLGLWLVGAVALRIALLHVTPSDDVYRYIWEGRVQLEGYNPFAHAPDDPVFESMRDDIWAGVNHRDYPAIYPPLAQAQFALAAAVSPSLGLMKAVFVALDVLAVLLIAYWLRSAGRSPLWAMVYALNPLVLTAFAVEGHLDSAMIALLAGVGIALEKRRTTLCGILLAGAILMKIVPVLLLPWLARKHIKAAIICVILVALGYVPYMSAEAEPFHSLVRFPRDTEMLSLGRDVVQWLVGAETLVAGIDTSRLVCAGVVMIVALWTALRVDKFARSCYLLMGALLLFLPIVHYWYLTWVVLMIPLVPRASWMVLSFSMVLYFEAARIDVATGTWAMPAWTPIPIYAPFIVTAIVEWNVRRRVARGPATGG